MALSAAKREKLERRLLEERIRALCALGRSVDTHLAEKEQDRLFDEGPASHGGSRDGHNG